jgi:hypothetical protein
MKMDQRLGDQRMKPDVIFVRSTVYECKRLILFLIVGIAIVLPSDASRAITGTSIASERTASDFTGTWIRKIDGRVFMILRLSIDGTEFKGTLSLPKHFSEVSGGQVTVTDPHVIVASVQSGAILDGKLHFSTQDQDDPKSQDQHILLVWDRDHASLNYYNMPFMPPWNLLRVGSGSDLSVVTIWPADTPQIFPPDIEALRKQLRSMVQEDQAADTPPYTNFKSICAKNRPVILHIFEKYGWLKQSVVGRDAAGDFWLLSVHQSDAHPELASRELAAMKNAVSEGEASEANYALFYDSVARSQGRPQHWGTKTMCKDGKRTLYPVDDLEGLERRRDEAQLPSLDFYLKSLPPCPPSN